MNPDAISLIIFAFSFLGLAFLIYRKIPVLNSLPPNTEKFSGSSLLEGVKNIVAKVPGLKSFSFEIFLQKVISQIRVISLKTDHKTFNWLQKLREKNQKKRLENDNYWEEIQSTNSEPKK